MPSNVVIAGPAQSVRDALASGHGESAAGVVLIGLGEVRAQAPVLARAAAWNALDLSALPADRIVLAAPPTPAEARALLAAAAEAGKTLQVVEGEALRPLQLDDLFGRPMAKMDWVRVGQAISGKRILITGGGGSIGSELARKVAGLAPQRLTILDSSEFNLYRISLELPDTTPVLADIRDAVSVRRWFERERPDIVFHAAALKQVPLVEAFASEGVLTNLCGLRNVAEASGMVGANLIFVSTDKAVEPSGVMGATKRLGELYCHALDRRGPTRAVPIRLGNVLGSTGSVTPVFEAQLKAGGPLTVTDPQVTRFFMSIPQAAKALLQAGLAGLREESARGAVFAIDMGEALPVVDLARDMIRLAGLRPDHDVPIVFTGLRPGEKLHELLVAEDEWREPSPAPNVIAAASTPRGLAEIQEIMDRLALLARQGAEQEITQELFAAIAPAGAAAERAAAS